MSASSVRIMNAAEREECTQELKSFFLENPLSPEEVLDLVRLYSSTSLGVLDEVQKN